MIEIEAWGVRLRVVGGEVRGRTGPALDAARELVGEYPYTAADPDPELGLANFLVERMHGRLLQVGPRDKDEPRSTADDTVQ